MTRTALQAEAARADGPASKDAAAKARRNIAKRSAVRHGLRARRLALPAFDDRAAFEELQAALFAAHRPADGQEMELVDAIVLACWQVRRGQDLELQYWHWMHPGATEDRAVWMPAQLLQEETQRHRTLETILRYQARAETGRARALRELRLHRAGKPEGAALPAAPEPVAANANEPGPTDRTDEPGTNRPEPAASRPVHVPAQKPRRTNEPEGAFARVVKRAVDRDPVAALKALLATERPVGVAAGGVPVAGEPRPGA